MKNLRILLDMDEVLCEFEKAACEAHGACHEKVRLLRKYNEWSLQGPLSRALGLDPMPLSDFWRPIHSQGEKFWKDIKPKPWIYDLITLVSYFDEEFLIVSAPSHCPTSRSGKFDWVKYHLGSNLAERLVLLGRKDLLANPYTVLIDDRDSNVRSFRRRGGLGVLFPAHGNYNWDHLHNPVQYVKSKLSRTLEI